MLSVMSHVHFNGNSDIWRWEGSQLGSFTVAAFKKEIKKSRNIHREHYTRWLSWIPLKVIVMIWRAEMDRLPTRLALVRRRINLQDMTCALCEDDNESVLHLFTGCGFSNGVWSIIGNWCKLSPVYAFEFKDLLLLHKAVRRSKWAKKVIQGIVMVSIWAIWKARNDNVFGRKEAKVVEVVASIKSMSLLWLKSRSSFKNLIWNEWVAFPLYMM